MTQYIAFSVGDGSSSTTIALPGQINAIVNDPNITAHFFAALFNTLLFIAVILTLAFLIYYGFKFMISEGDKKEIETARTAIINSLIGLIIAFFAFFVVNVLGYFFFNIPLFSLPF